MTPRIAAEKYILPLGKYKGMYATDVLRLVIVDKNNSEKRVGEQYLSWLIKQSWFRDTEIIQEVLKMDEEKPTEEESKPKKEKKEKKYASVKISTNETLDMNSQ